MLPIRDHNPSGRTPYVTYSIISINCIIFFSYWGNIHDPQIINEFFSSWALIPYNLTQGEDLFTLITSIFLHAGILHLAGNMLFLHMWTSKKCQIWKRRAPKNDEDPFNKISKIFFRKV